MNKQVNKISDMSYWIPSKLSLNIIYVYIHIYIYIYIYIYMPKNVAMQSLSIWKL